MVKKCHKHLKYWNRVHKVYDFPYKLSCKFTQNASRPETPTNFAITFFALLTPTKMDSSILKNFYWLLMWLRLANPKKSSTGPLSECVKYQITKRFWAWKKTKKWHFSGKWRKIMHFNYEKSCIFNHFGKSKNTW